MSKPGYRTRTYRAMKAYLAENDVTCVWCMRARATTPDHSVPLVLGGTDDDLVPSCAPCNLKRAGQLGSRLRRARREARAAHLNGVPWP